MIVTISRRFIDDEPGLPLVWGYLSRITHIDTWTLGIYLPLIIFVLEVFVIYKLAKDAFNWRVGFLSALFLAVVPGHIYRSHAGGIWKDTLGSLFMLMFLHSVILITKSRGLDHRKMLKYGTYLVASLYLSAFTFDGFGAFPGAVSLYLALSPLIKKPRKNEFLITGLIVPPLVLAYLTLPTYTRESYALLPFLIASIISLVVLDLGYYLSKHPKGKIIYGGVLIIVSVLLVYFVLFDPPSFLENTSRVAWEFLLLNKYGLSAQSRPNSLSLLFLTWFSVSLIFAMLGVFYAIRNIKRRENLLILAWSAVSAFLGIATIRLTFIMSFAVAMTAALGMEFVYVQLDKRLDFKKAISISMIVLLIGIVPTFYEGKDYVSMPPFPPDYWLDALEWMHNDIAGEVVFNWWDWGYWLEAYGVKATSDNYLHNAGYYPTILALQDKELEKVLYFINKTNELIMKNSGLKSKNKVGHILVSDDLLLKLGAFNYFLPQKLRINALYVLFPKVMRKDIVVCQYGDVILNIDIKNMDATMYSKVDNAKQVIFLNDIVIEVPRHKNKILHNNYNNDARWNVYLSPHICALFPLELKNRMLFKLLVYEDEIFNFTLEYDNGYIKLYKLPTTQAT